jgi:hypothetical protein
MRINLNIGLGTLIFGVTVEFMEFTAININF